MEATSTNPLRREQNLLILDNETTDQNRDGAPDEALESLTNLAMSHIHDFNEKRELATLEQALCMISRAISLTPKGDSDLPLRIGVLANIHREKYEHLDELAHLDEAVKYYGQAISLALPDHPNMLEWLHSLAYMLDHRFEQTDEITDLNKAIEYYSQVLLLGPQDNSDKPTWLNSLADSLHSRFRRLGELLDLDKAIGYQSHSISLTPQDDLSIPEKLDQLGYLFDSRFQRLGELADLDKAVEYKSHAVALAPQDNLHTPRWLNSLAYSLDFRYERLGKLTDLEKGIECMQKSISLTPEESSSMPTQLSNLGSSLASRFERLGKLADLDQAIQFKSKAISLVPEDHEGMPGWLGNLGSSLEIRYKRLGESEDLDEAIEYKIRSVSLTPQGVPEIAIGLNNLALSLESRFQHAGNISDLNEAIEYINQAIAITPQGDSDMPSWLNNLSFLLGSRFGHLGDLADLDKEIEHNFKAVSLTPQDHAQMPLRLSNLGSSLKSRFQHRGQLLDLNRAILCISQAISLTPRDHPDMPNWLQSLGSAYRSRSELLGVFQDTHRSLYFLQMAAECPAGHPDHRFEPALQWARMCDRHCSPSLLKAYQQAMTLLPQVVWLGNTVGHRYSHILKSGDVATEAAAAAIKTGDYGRALEWLEEGKSIVWKQMLHLRIHLDDLTEVSPTLASELQQVAQDLDHVSLLKPIHPIASLDDLCPEHSAQRRRRLAENWENLADQVRSLPGFESFLRPPKVAELMRSAQSGPVVVINVYKTRCDALVIRPNRPDILHIPLQLSCESVTRFRAQTQYYARSRGPNQRGIQVAKHNPDNLFVQMLAALWKEVVRPVLDSLGYIVQKSSSIDQMPHITWCTTGSLSYLPIHAAGDYESQSMVFDYVVSSYTPTLSALLSPPSAHSTFSGILTVGQALTPDMAPLPGTVAELTHIQVKSCGLPVTRLDGDLATPAAVLTGMQEHSWVHMACHAIQISINPMKSAFYLHGGMLTLAEITQKQLKQADFAFLSACQTATGDENLPDEAVHLAAGMLMAGYRTVIATMWSIGDDDAPLVAETVYEHLLEGGKPDARRAAVALHKAMGQLRAKVGVREFVKWVPYIHIGL